MIADLNRGTNLEFLLTVLAVWLKHGARAQFIALSAVIGSTHGLPSGLAGCLPTGAKAACEVWRA